jgi:hypothetical protein
MPSQLYSLPLFRISAQSLPTSLSEGAIYLLAPVLQGYKLSCVRVVDETLVSTHDVGRMRKLLPDITLEIAIEEIIKAHLGRRSTPSSVWEELRFVRDHWQLLPQQQQASLVEHLLLPCTLSSDAERVTRLERASLVLHCSEAAKLLLSGLSGMLFLDVCSISPADASWKRFFDQSLHLAPLPAVADHDSGQLTAVMQELIMRLPQETERCVRFLSELDGRWEYFRPHLALLSPFLVLLPIPCRSGSEARAGHRLFAPAVFQPRFPRTIFPQPQMLLRTTELVAALGIPQELTVQTLMDLYETCMLPAAERGDPHDIDALLLALQEVLNLLQAGAGNLTDPACCSYVAAA